MSDSSASSPASDDSQPTPDHLLHTGTEGPIDPEDLVRLSGREPTPELVEEARRRLEEEGPAAAERYLP
ncbi:hypothetical protein [Streptomyces radicis]|uniref:Uncharacterized protein n=1 Tax=Streptomyces radicis TaxID=1750517 RepID=A0A3A9W5X9_9ACTN|nr:hypothetical protein [Streptomyces radicis]RKN08611.1 hypothetical protein D7319_14540 [Streptomyces radicis]RKN21769.1 hypothetical protein D7318_15495 [Streptomyces radicis]